MSHLPLFQVDAFTDRPFSGNPAAVCLLSGPREPAWMQRVAAEMNLSETAFLTHRDDGYDLRWFTPTVEVDLCGHATLASAFVLWEQGFLPVERPARFHTRSGLLTAERRDGLIELDFPSEPARETDSPEGLDAALGAAVRAVGRNRFDLLVELDSETAVRALDPDFRRLAAIPARGVIVTAPASTEGFDFVSRFFAPQSGIEEDPVTGSAHCCLAPYWTARLGRDALTGYQASPRGGVVRVRQAGDRVRLIGQAALVFRAELVC